MVPYGSVVRFSITHGGVGVRPGPDGEGTIVRADHERCGRGQNDRATPEEVPLRVRMEFRNRR